MTTSTLATLTARLRLAADWRPATGTGGRVLRIRCPHCRIWRKPRHFRRLGGGCRRCIGT